MSNGRCQVPDGCLSRHGAEEFGPKLKHLLVVPKLVIEIGRPRSLSELHQAEQRKSEIVGRQETHFRLPLTTPGASRML